MSRMLLIKGQNDNEWFGTLARAASDLENSVTRIDQTQVDNNLRIQNYEMAILDANTLSDPASIVNLIRSCAPQVRIVVVASTPHWKQARELLLRGATDYVRKVDDRDAIKHMLQKNLSRIPLERRRNCTESEHL